MSYGDSDDDEERDGTQLITLDGSTNRDRTHSAADNIPKLSRPE